MNPGDHLDHYRIDSVVSRSDVATVFRGTDLRTNHPVAIKMLHPEIEIDPSVSDRFHREEEIERTLHHPGLLKAVPDNDHSRSYLVTEWFDGLPLRQLLVTEKRISLERAVRIAVRVCDVLTYIHGHGVVHRDLKPENILVDTEDHIKLANFRFAAKEGSPRITFTNLSQVLGASSYTSPEELKGNRGDARSDIYALGVILYEMLTAKLPFQGKDPFERLSGRPIPPREIEPAISPQLQEVVYRALEREHKDRYSSAHEFALDLTHLDRVGIAERPELRDGQKQMAPNSKKALLYVAVALIPAAIFGLLIYFSRR